MITSMISKLIKYHQIHLYSVHVYAGVASVLSNSLQPYGLYSSQLLCPWASPGKTTGVGCHTLLQWILPAQRSNADFLSLLHQQAGSLPLVPPYIGFM